MVPLRTKGDEGIVWDGWPVGRSVRSSGCVRPKDLDFGVASVAGLDAGAAAAARTAADGEAGIEGGKRAASKGASAGFSGLYARVSSRSTAMGRERGGMAPAPGRRRHLRRGANRRNQEQYGTIICFPIGLQGGGKRLCAGRIRTLDGLIHACNLRKARGKVAVSTSIRCCESARRPSLRWQTGRQGGPRWWDSRGFRRAVRCVKPGAGSA